MLALMMDALLFQIVKYFSYMIRQVIDGALCIACTSNHSENSSLST